MGLLFFFRRNATQVYNWARIASGAAKEKVDEVMQLKDQGVPSVSPAWSTKMTSDPTSGVISSCVSSGRASTIWKEIIWNRNARQCLNFISVNHVFHIKHCCAVKFKFTVIRNTVEDLDGAETRKVERRVPRFRRVNTLCLETSKQRTCRFINILHYTKKN